MLNISNEIQTNFENASLEEAIERLTALQRRKRDFVTPIQNIGMLSDGRIIVEYSECSENGFGISPVMKEVTVNPNHFAHGQIASKFNIPVGYWRRMIEERPELAAQNLNGWIRHFLNEKGDDKTRRVLIRAYMDQPGGSYGVLRAMLSDRYLCYDNIDILALALKSMKNANDREGTQLMVDKCDLTDTNMFVRVVDRKAKTEAREALKNYKDPNDGNTGGTGIDNGIVFGFCIKNSEVGAGTLSVSPLAHVKACRNNMIWRDEAFRKVHLGGKLSEGEALWSEDTKSANILLIEKQLKDIIKRFCSADFISKQVKEINEMAMRKLEHPVEVINNMSSAFNFSETERNGIFEDFIKSMTENNVFSIAQAVTSFAQKVPAERRYELEMASTELMKSVSKWDIAKVEN